MHREGCRPQGDGVSNKEKLSRKKHLQRTRYIKVINQERIMTYKEFSIEINASPEKVWFALWDDWHFRLWTNIFYEGSYMVTTWKEGGKVHFLSPGGEGMFSLLELNQPCEKMHFRHIGTIKNFEEQPRDEESELWKGSREYYSLSVKDGVTLLHVSVDIPDQFLDFTLETFPKGLAIVKQMAENFMITVTARIDKSVDEVWEKWTAPKHIAEWNYASDDWHSPYAENDLKKGGKFLTRMEAKDGSFGFDFWGIYDQVDINREIRYTMGDGRKAKITFTSLENKTEITESFEAESTNSPELQRNGWQAILNNFRNYCEKG
jgi:uncharacterized protein YndB with AHSA1/START domain